MLAEEVSNSTRFSVTLQIAAHNLTPARQRGNSLSEAAILVRSEEQGSQVWSMDRLENRLVSMRDLYEERLMLGHNAAVPPSRLNPFFDPSENQTFVGVANIFLEALYEEVALNYLAPIISPQGEVVGRLVVELERIGGGLLLLDRLG